MNERVLQLDENEPWFFSDYFKWFLTVTLHEWTSTTWFVCQSTSVHWPSIDSQWMVSGPLMDAQGFRNAIPHSPLLYPLSFDPLQSPHVHEHPWASMTGPLTIHWPSTAWPCVDTFGRKIISQLVSTWMLMDGCWPLMDRGFICIVLEHPQDRNIISILSASSFWTILSVHERPTTIHMDFEIPNIPSKSPIIPECPWVSFCQWRETISMEFCLPMFGHLTNDTRKYNGVWARATKVCFVSS